MSSEIILFDLPSKGDHPKCWSLNPWKARLALNYKGVPYKTEWTEYPDIADKFKQYGIPANDRNVNPNAEYSCPAARFPDGSYVMDSRKIAETLDKLAPQPSLHTNKGELIDRVQQTVLGCQGALAPLLMPAVPDLLPPRSAEYFHATRAKRFGMPLAEFAKSDKGGENAWKNAEPHLATLKDILAEKDSGVFVLGGEVSFADFIIAGFWDFLRKTNEEAFARVMKIDKRFGEHHKACAKWLEVDD
ncbi:hypothetical protein BDY17DRAFT_317377 [Neohortaea acidophila]|uniref:Uncharacterized protein n=1 Tax=Neohortaea acidophila TaxID=245834 RepID=A0A6A6PST3_9PEZI|nr:uncharacterized protein BDY17DRAFT_317377 [Neohortaea acidophila]KAF2482836.1 hypothetical protein BDY17DRAFT_317377 [Neohortaea acidophila]